MMKYVREFRLIPVVLLATASLAALKLLGLLLDGGYLLTDLGPATIDRPIRVESAATVADNKVSMPLPGGSWAQRMLGFPDVSGGAAADGQARGNADRNAERKADSTGNSPGPPAAPPPAKVEKPPDGKVIELDTKPAPSASERA